jgi:hypothetical protein
VGWKDAPVVDEDKPKGGWQSAPEVTDAPQPEPTPEPTPQPTAPKSRIPAIVNYSPVAGAGETILNLASGAVAAPLSGLAGIGQAATNALGLTDTPAADRVAQVGGALTYEPRTKAGQVGTKIVSYPFELLARGADAAGGKVADVTGSPAAGAAVNTAIQAAPLAIGPLARKLPGESAANVAARWRTERLNQPLAEQVAAARKVGLKITPEEAHGGIITRNAASLAGEPKLAKLASRKNAPVLNDLIRKDLALPDDVPISRQALAQIRAEEGLKYDTVKSVGRFGTDAKYQADLHEITKSFDTAAKDFSHRSENPFKKTMEGLKVESMDAAAAVEEIKLLRFDADKAYRTGDPGLGKAFKAAAQALDDQLARHLDRHAGAVADPAMKAAVADYKNARVRIAKSYAAEKALVEETGNINPAVYGRELNKGKPLTGGAKQVGEFSNAFPRSTQRTERLGATGATFFDYLLGGSAGIMGTALGGMPGAAGVALGASRPIARSVLLSDPVQSVITRPRSYGPSGFRTLQQIMREAGEEAALVGISSGQDRERNNKNK